MWKLIRFSGIIYVFLAFFNGLSGSSLQISKQKIGTRFKLEVGERGEGDINLGPVTDFQCPDGMKIAPHPYYCDLYYTCYANDAVTLWKCYSDYLFDLEFYGCNFPYLVDCGDRLPPEQRTTTTTTESNVDTTTSRTTEPITSDSTTTSENPTTTTLPTTTESITTTNEPVRPAPTFPCPSANGFFPISEESCAQHYYGCIDGTAYLLRCPGDTFYDPIKYSCQESSTVSCSANFFRCSQYPNGFYPVPGSYCTNVYYSCQESQLTEKVCPGTSLFDVTRNLCAPAETVQCYWDQQTTTPLTSTPDSGSQTANPSTPTPGSGSQTTQTPIPFVCPNQDGLYPDPNSCHSYYRCIAGTPFFSVCDSGNCYDPSIESCSQIACSLC